MRIFFFLISFFLAAQLNAQCGDRYKENIFPSTTRYSNIPYGSNTNNLGEVETLLMDVYTPMGDTASLRPIMIFVHGGSFIGGNKEEFVAMASEFARKGYVTASINYRVHQGTNPIAPILDFADDKNWYRAIIRAVQDTKAAIRYFKKDAAENGNTYKIDTSNIILYGSSAGAIAILHAVFMADSAQLSNRYRDNITFLGGLEDQGGSPGYSSSLGIKAVVSCSGALGSANWVKFRKDVALIGFHNNPDLTVPYDIGCYIVAFCHLGQFYGGKSISDKAQEFGLTQEFYTFNAPGHPADGYDKPFVISKTTDFLYKLQCESVPTPVKDLPTEQAQIFPNPSNGNFRIVLPSGWKAVPPGTLRIMDLTGKTLLKEKLQGNNQFTIQTNLPSGLYQVIIVPNDPAYGICRGSVMITSD